MILKINTEHNGMIFGKKNWTQRHDFRKKKITNKTAWISKKKYWTAWFSKKNTEHNGMIFEK